MKTKITLSALAVSLMMAFQVSAQGVVYPEIFEKIDDPLSYTGIYDKANLLANPGFEDVTDFEPAVQNKGIPTSWTCPFGFASFGMRVVLNSADFPTDPAKREGFAEMLWRNDGGDYGDKFMYQELAANLAPSTWYKIKFRTMAHNQNRVTPYFVGVGSTMDGMEYSKNKFQALAQPMGTTRDYEFTFKTPAELGTQAFFTIKNANGNTGVNNNNWTLIHLDRMTLTAGVGDVVVPPVENVSYPDLFAVAHNVSAKTGIYDVANLFVNPGFEQADVILKEDPADTRAVPNDWFTDYTNGFEKMGMRVNVNNVAYATNREGLNTLLWRNDAEDKKGISLYQEVTGKIEPSTWYQIKFRVISNGQDREPDYYVGLGSTLSGIEYGVNTFKGCLGKTGEFYDYTCSLKTPATLGEKSYFTIRNQTAEEGANNGTWTLFNLDCMTLVKGKVEATAIKDNTLNAVKVYAVEGRIVVEGADRFTVFNLQGMPINANTTLSAGIYIVSANGAQYKVFVK